MTKKIFAMFLAVLMVVSMLPTSVFAAGCPAEHTKSNCEYTEVGKTAPNCGNKGYTTYKCNACGETFVADFVDPVGEHDWKDADPVKETCEVNGSVGGKECKVCHKVVDATPVDEIPNGLKCEYSEWTPATFDCKEGATQNRYCVHCGGKDPNPREYKAQDDHKMGAWELKTPATAEAEGLAVKKCLNPNCNYVEEQVVFFDHDHNDQTLSAVAKVDAKCNETGINAHYECRICGGLFKTKDGAYVATTLAELSIKSKHDTLKDGLTCTSTTAECSVCKEVVTVSAADAHNYDKWVIVTAPGCMTDGFEKRTCKNCANTETQIIKPLGHDLQTVEVAATCVSYAYTYTYCTRANCTNYVEVKLPEEHNAAKYQMVEHKLSYITEAPAAEIGFYLALYQNSKYVNIPLYFTGAMEGNYLATSSDYREAVKVFVEVVDGGFLMFFKEGETKTYIEIYEYATGKAGVRLTAEPENVYAWNAEHQVLTTVIAGKTFYLNAYNNFTTISASEIKYISTSFPARLNAVDSFEAAKVMSYSIDKTAGVDVNAHDYKVLSKVDATCLAEGVKISSCADCNAVKNETLAKVDHKWIADTTKGSNNDGVDEATCTTAGKKYFVCGYSGCNETKEEAVAALGHELTKNPDKSVKVFTHDGDHTDPVAYDYNWCERCKQEVNKTNYRAWANAGKIWDTPEAAEAAHGTLTPAATTVAGSCSVVGYTTYTCSGCSEIVRVKIPHTGAHYAGDGVVAYKAPTCTEAGFSLNFKCVNCGKLADETKAENHVTNLPALGHTWKEFTAEEREALGLGKYEKAPCGAPVYDNYIAYCSVCHPNGLSTLEGAILKADTKRLEPTSMDFTGALCVASIYELYECHCGETHMRSFLVTEVNVNHEWIVDTSKTEIKATHTATGTKFLVCKYCDETETETLPMLPHKNAAGEEFTDHCNDNVTDRHCVLCCTQVCKDAKHDCTKHDTDDKTEGVQPCKCVIGKHHDWSEKTYVGSICGDAPYYSEICSYCYETKAVDAEEYWTGDLNEKGEKVMAPIFGLGHKPVAADADKYGQYTYVKITHPEYVWVDGVVVMTAESKVEYEAKYIEYKAPTHTADGFAKFVCADCGQTIETVLKANNGLGFELEYANANGKDGLTIGSLVNVTLYANGNNVDVNNFTLVGDFDGMIFVGAQSANDNFHITVTQANIANSEGGLAIIANAINSADKKQQNITIGEKTPIVTMQFIAWGVGEFEVEMDGEAFALNGAEVNCNSKVCKINVKMPFDFNDDKKIHISDLIQAEAILTGESEKTYDVAVDVDKDGEVTLYDLNLIYEFIVNSIGITEESALEFFCNGLAEEHVEIIKEHLKKAEEATMHECIGKYCSYTDDEKFDICPVCNTVQ